MNEHFCRLVSDYLIHQETKEERATLAQRLIAFLGVVCLIVLVGVATNAYAAPRADNPQECAMVGDMALVAASLLKNEVDAAKSASIMDDTYSNLVGGAEGKKWLEIRSLVMSLVAKPAMRDLKPSDIGMGVNTACHEGQGDLTPILGSPTM